MPYDYDFRYEWMVSGKHIMESTFSLRQANLTLYNAKPEMIRRISELLLEFEGENNE